MASVICCINILTQKKPLRLPRSRQPKVRTLLLPKKAQKALAILVMIACTILCCFICKFGFQIVQTQLAKNQLSPAMRIPMGYMYAAIPVGMIFFIIRYVQDIIEAIRDFNKPEEKKEVAE